MILAIDQGTSGTTCLVVDDELAVRGRGARPLETHFPHPGWVEQDPDAIWQSVLDGRRATPSSDAGIAPRELRGDRHHQPARDDRALGAPLVAARRARDRLAGSPHGRALRRLPRELIRERTGLVPDPYFSAQQARVAARPDARPRRTRSRSARSTRGSSGS